MLLDGAIRFALQAKDALAERDFAKSSEKISRCLAIIVEMQLGLRPEVNPAICDRMKALYNFIYRTLLTASMERDPAKIDEVLKVLRIQRDTWAIIVEKVAGARDTDGRGGKDAPPERTPVGDGTGPTVSLNLEG